MNKFALRKSVATAPKQAGFINGLLIIGIALMAVVVGALAMASSSSSTDIAKQKTKTTASVGMKKMADAVEAYQISAADLGQAGAEAAIVVPAMPKGFQTTAAAATYTSPDFQVSGVDPAVCAQINTTLGLDTQPADVTAFSATGITEGCTTGNVYVRVVHG